MYTVMYVYCIPIKIHVQHVLSSILVIPFLCLRVVASCCPNLHIPSASFVFDPGRVPEQSPSRELH